MILIASIGGFMLYQYLTQLELNRVIAKQAEELKSVQAVQAKPFEPAQMDRELKAAFESGKRLASSGLKPKEIIRYKTVTETIQMPSTCPDAMSVDASISEAKLETIQGQQWLLSEVSIHLFDIKSGFDQSVNLKPEMKSVNFQIESTATPQTSQPASLKKFHFGRTYGCGVGIVADVNAWPTASAGIGVGAFCGVTFGLTK